MNTLTCWLFNKSQVLFVAYWFSAKICFRFYPSIHIFFWILSYIKCKTWNVQLMWNKYSFKGEIVKHSTSHLTNISNSTITFNGDAVHSLLQLIIIQYFFTFNIIKQTLILQSNIRLPYLSAVVSFQLVLLH